ncbi:Xaa-Pro aminopeptidase [Candidatus Tachikawaea gelatinosa]|uniref:Xaa-Pro aminopeptidase n=1 Tax=Candidatus Tachikawaea gelatinosa TaxID=1410383 RepID=A0A090ALV2_9ENTR|nr:Xaa-Pro aminopeptidase [Candidatus Tachikawaea gelatinosa]BAP58639.1 proline aminopeptidase P II [Candidatus Tachikawaea gelatinosa]
MFKAKTFIKRRKTLFNHMQRNSAALIFSASTMIRSNDTHYSFRQNSDFWYLTGFNEPNSLLLLIKNKNYSILFNRDYNYLEKIYFGNCLGQSALDLTGVNQVISWNLINDTLYQFLSGLDVIYHATGLFSQADQILFDTLKKIEKFKLKTPTKIFDCRSWIHQMRVIKSKEEIKILRHAAKISTKAHQIAMIKCRPGLFEYHLEGIIHYQFNKRGARFQSYSTIVASGNNACILHYDENKNKLKSGDLVLVDAGCEYYGYASDITRTYPTNGKFNFVQLSIYKIVLSALYKALSMFRPNVTVKSINNAVIKVIVTGLIKLGILNGNINSLIRNHDYREFYMHNISHFIGLDVHDVYSNNLNKQDYILKPGMVLTVEPGIYINFNKKVPKEYQGIGIRIEDTILINESGYENFTSDLLKDPINIENIMC